MIATYVYDDERDEFYSTSHEGETIPAGAARELASWGPDVAEIDGYDLRVDWDGYYLLPAHARGDHSGCDRNCSAVL